jgi:hypothetical protein
MKLKKAMKTIDEGWVRRQKGYRIQFQKKVDSEWITDCFPDPEEKPLTSDISAWELARRFSEAARNRDEEPAEPEMINIHVVDDLGNPVRFYGTNELTVYNKRDT